MGDSATPSPEALEGVVERIIYQNEESGYGVALLVPADHSGAATITGPLAGLRQGERLRCRGRWIMHPRFGRQFEVSEFETRHPSTRQGIIKYLSGGEIKGIGPKLAATILDTLGNDTLKIIDETPERLLEVPGIATPLPIPPRVKLARTMSG